MKRVASVIALGFALGIVVAVGSAFPGDDAKLDPAKLAGDWTYVEGKKEGTAIEKDHLQGVVKVDKTKFTIPGEPGQVFVMSYKLDGAKNPAEIDITIDDAPIKEAIGSTSKGIVSVDGDTMKLCYAPVGARPTAFESTAENKTHSFVLKRAK
jgi:uncharacterized protein (TIGR03067 family)